MMCTESQAFLLVIVLAYFVVTPARLCHADKSNDRMTGEAAGGGDIRGVQLAGRYKHAAGNFLLLHTV
jgi:hypothetical protein